jgi:hypothetical protein
VGLGIGDGEGTRIIHEVGSEVSREDQKEVVTNWGTKTNPVTLEESKF